MTDISSQTLHVVAKELGSTLNDARAALEAYSERPDQIDLLEKCAESLHQARQFSSAQVLEHLHVQEHLADGWCLGIGRLLGRRDSIELGQRHHGAWLDEVGL